MIHHCKETGHVNAIVRTDHGQPTWFMCIRATWLGKCVFKNKVPLADL